MQPSKERDADDGDPLDDLDDLLDDDLASGESSTSGDRSRRSSLPREARRQPEPADPAGAPDASALTAAGSR